ncbi:hypothetical protein DPEC_G00211220, partial [Dallia pectoralis]
MLRPSAILHRLSSAERNYYIGNRVLLASRSPMRNTATSWSGRRVPGLNKIRSVFIVDKCHNYEIVRCHAFSVTLWYQDNQTCAMHVMEMDRHLLN